MGGTAAAGDRGAASRLGGGRAGKEVAGTPVLSLGR